MEDESSRDKTAMAESEGPRTEERISAFDAAGYIFQMVGEMSAMSRRYGFQALTADLERARDAAAQAMIDTRRGD